MKQIDGIVSQAMGEAEPVKCKTISSLMDEAEEAIHSAAEASVRDAALIAAANKIQHYQIAGYGTARQFATTLGLEGDTQILAQIKNKIADSDRSLISIAEQINQLAVRASH